MSQFVTSQGLAAMINAGKNVVNLGDAIGKPIAQGLATRYKNQRQDELLAQQTQRQDQLLADKYQREDDKLAAAQQLSEQQRQDAILASQFANVADEAQFSELMNAGVQNGTIDDDDIAQINQAYNMGGLAGVNQLGKDLLATSNYADNFMTTNKVGRIRYIDTGNEIEARDTSNNTLLETIPKTQSTSDKEIQDLKKQELDLKAQEKKDKAKAAKQKLIDENANSILALENSLATISQLKSSPGFQSAVGTSSILPTLPGSESADFERILEKFQSQQFLNGIESMRGFGTLTETEGKKVTQAAQALNLDMSEKAFMAEATIVTSTLENALKRQQAKRKKLLGGDSKKLKNKKPKGKSLPMKNSQGWVLMTDKSGKQAYVSPDRTQFEEVE